MVIKLTFQWTDFFAIGGIIGRIVSPIGTNRVTLYEIVVAQVESGGTIGCGFGSDFYRDTTVFAVTFLSKGTINARFGRAIEFLIFITFINAIASIDAAVPSFIIFALRYTSIWSHGRISFSGSTLVH